MESTRLQRTVVGLLSVWVLLLIVATAYRGAANWMDADVVLNSVMSLQRVTVFYWGQNRILNVLPAAIWVLRDAAWNLGAVLLLSSAFFYGSLVMVGRMIAGALDLRPWPRFALIAAITSVAPVVVEGVSLNSLAIGHIEYSLPLLLMLVAFSLILGARPSRSRLGAAALLVFVAGGVNPASCLVALTIAAARISWRRQAEWCSLGFAGMALLALSAWSMIARHFGDSNYGLQDGYRLAEIMGGVGELARAVFTAVNLPALLVLLGVVSAAIMIRQLVLGPPPAARTDLVRHGYVALTAFCVFWLFTLSVNFWVKQNQYHLRYTSYVLFAGLSALGVWFAQWDWTRWRAVGLVGLALLMTTAARDLDVTRLRRPYLQDMAAFKSLPKSIDPDVQLYAGDYWEVWPAVFLQLARSKVAYGLAFRGEVMADRIRDLAWKQPEGELLDVYCFGAKETLCTEQVRSVLAAARYVGSRKDAGGLRQQYRVVGPGLEYAGADFLALKSTTGAATSDGRATDGRAGVLFFGPYAAVPAGRYRLTVCGKIQKLQGVRIEIVAQGGQRVLLSTVPQIDASGAIIHDVDVDIPDGVSDLEIRAVVTANDVMTVSGYSLLPVKP
jgi:hypothetical protein